MHKVFLEHPKRTTAVPPAQELRGAQTTPQALREEPSPHRNPGEGPQPYPEGGGWPRLKNRAQPERHSTHSPRGPADQRPPHHRFAPSGPVARSYRGCVAPRMLPPSARRARRSRTTPGKPAQSRQHHHCPPAPRSPLMAARSFPPCPAHRIRKAAAGPSPPLLRLPGAALPPAPPFRPSRDRVGCRRVPPRAMPLPLPLPRPLPTHTSARHRPHRRDGAGQTARGPAPRSPRPWGREEPAPRRGMPGPWAAPPGGPARRGRQ
ncbi:basic proline-rich protein-like [Calypte anna]|uniref:basic proline-rich protein-like n=1 Tax=Calypte anna TaxID=9244 RepID=UPI0011C3A0D0|nr:basic proline-rich protein-like [Calypte anna]